jgi:hypothetical protein
VGEGIEDEAGQARREDGIARPDPVHRLQQFAAGNGLRDVAAGSGTDNGDHVLGGIGDGEGEELHLGMVREDARQHGVAAAAGEVDVEQDDVGDALVDELDGRLDLVGLADDLDGVAELGPHAGPEDGMVLDQEDPGRRPPSSARGSGPPAGGGVGSSGWVAAAWAWSARPRCPRPGVERMITRATVASHAGPDRLGDALAVGRDGVGIEALPPVAHEQHDGPARPRRRARPAGRPTIWRS